MIIEIEDKVLFKGTRLEDSWIKNGADLIDRVSLKLRAKKNAGSKFSILIV